jgi:hypothetical protein
MADAVPVCPALLAGAEHPVPFLDRLAAFPQKRQPEAAALPAVPEAVAAVKAFPDGVQPLELQPGVVPVLALVPALAQILQVPEAVVLSVGPSGAPRQVLQMLSQSEQPQSALPVRQA